MGQETGNTEEAKTLTSENDLSKVKIRYILLQRFKKYGFKKIIAMVVLAIVFFMGGFMTDRLTLKHGGRIRSYGKAGIQRNIPRNSYNKKNFKSGGNIRKNSPSSNDNSPQNSSQSKQ